MVDEFNLGLWIGDRNAFEGVCSLSLSLSLSLYSHSHFANIRDGLYKQGWPAIHVHNGIIFVYGSIINTGYFLCCVNTTDIGCSDASMYTRAKVWTSKK